MKKEHEVISNRKMSDREKELWEELQKLAKFMYEKFPEYETTNDESFVHKAIRIIVDLKSQLASIKYLSEYEIDKAIFGQMDYDEYGNIIDFNANKAAQAICNLAIPDIDRDKINQELLDQLYRFEGIMGKYDCQLGGMECNFQIAFHRLIRAEIDEIIKAIRGEE